VASRNPKQSTMTDRLKLRPDLVAPPLMAVPMERSPARVVIISIQHIRVGKAGELVAYGYESELLVVFAELEMRFMRKG